MRKIKGWLGASAVVLVTMTGFSVAILSASQEHDVQPVRESELYGRWDGVVTVDGQAYCLEDWPCYDGLVNPGFEG